LLFKRDLDDIEITEKGIIADFYSILGENIISPTVILFRLKVKDEQILALLQGKRTENHSKKIRLFFAPPYMVIARIEAVSRIRRYDPESRGKEKEAGDVDVQPRFIAYGSLIEAVKPEKPEKKDK
jgi:hypothetical protein